ncbi:MAG: RsmE family RNA methyltransferase, partial [Clostridia bacterium]|nr:RsmE family RNA methyltransferase [Clostridia bacterium]
MEIKRFYGSKLGDKLVLSDREYYHCVKVTRHKAGYSLIVCIGDGKDYYSTIDKITANEVICSIQSVEDNNSETKAPLILCQAVCKELDFIVQKAVELGISEIIPFYSDRTNVKKVSLERLENIVIDAAKQCG